jgi:hypothetical protein
VTVFPGNRAALLLVVFLLALGLAGCGKKGLPQATPDEPDRFPRSYPAPTAE